ncbi:hypothetical protein A33M_0371 [Rhodovulum sp. PH10]|nr:hypothetical protein A33M_0371 [Rhodovulum sp. PH10]
MNGAEDRHARRFRATGGDHRTSLRDDRFEGVARDQRCDPDRDRADPHSDQIRPPTRARLRIAGTVPASSASPDAHPQRARRLRQQSCCVTGRG